MLASILTVEALVVIIATVVTAVELAGRGAKVESDGIAFVVCLVLACLWVVAAALGAWLVQTWARGLIITWQLIQLAVGVGALQGLLAGPLLGVVLLVLGLAGIGLVLAPAVSRRLGREGLDERGDKEA
ncbi:MAG: hypothetical protein FWD85_04775 [Microbacteriaceae bacterium]|nr:hypothetical protein [Microbacteriaceae bacterium]MCL2794605.1 hypothetical protein [Microbacteriaceae bacterium]